MVNLKCNDYGFECNFVSEGEMEIVIDEFREHTDEVHGIDYSKDAVKQFLLRKQGL
jgi:predicted small metal-binding protein